MGRGVADQLVDWSNPNHSFYFHFIYQPLGNSDGLQEGGRVPCSLDGFKPDGFQPRGDTITQQ